MWINSQQWKESKDQDERDNRQLKAPAFFSTGMLHMILFASFAHEANQLMATYPLVALLAGGRSCTF